MKNYMDTTLTARERAELLLKEYKAEPREDLLNRIVEAHLYIAAIIARRSGSRPAVSASTSPGFSH